MLAVVLTLALNQMVLGTLGVLVAVLGLILLAGLVAGQFRRGVVQELRDSLHTANTEIEIERRRSDRLDAESKELRLEVIALRTEVATLRSVLTDDRKLAQTVANELSTVHRSEVDEILNAIGNGCARVIEALQKEGA